MTPLNSGPMDPERMEKFRGEIYDKSRYPISIFGHKYGNGKITKTQIRKSPPGGRRMDPRHLESFLLRSLKETRYTM